MESFVGERQVARMSTKLWTLRMRHASKRGEKSAKTPTAEAWGRRFVILIILAWAASFVIGFETALTILVLVGFAAAVMGLRSPAIGLLGIGILATLDALTRVFLLSGGLLRWNTLNYWLVIVILLYVPFILRLNDPHSRLLQVFLLLLSFGLLISPSLGNGIQDILNIVATFALVVYFARALEEDQAFYWLGIVNGVLAAVGGLAFNLQQTSLTYINPNALAVFPLTALFSICLGYPRTEGSQTKKLILLSLAAVNFMWIFLSGSRGNLLIGLCCVLFLLFSTRIFSRNSIFLIIIISLGFWISLGFVDLQTYTVGRWERLFDTAFTLAERTSGRSDIALAGWYLFLENPLGVGTGGFESSVSSFEILDFEGRPAHSAWIKTLAENGIPGIIFLVAYVASFAIVGLEKRNQGLLLVGLLVTVSFGISFLSTEFQGKSLWLLAAGGTVLLHKKEMIQHIRGGARFRGGRNKFLWRYRRRSRMRCDRSE